MIVGVLTTCHTQYTSDRSICFFLFTRTTLQVFVTYLTGALYVHPLWFYKHKHDNRVRSKLFVACQRWWFQWRFWFVPSVPGYLQEEEEHNPDPWRNPIERNHMGLLLKCIVYCVWPRQSLLITLYFLPVCGALVSYFRWSERKNDRMMKLRKRAILFFRALQAFIPRRMNLKEVFLSPCPGLIN